MSTSKGSHPCKSFRTGCSLSLSLAVVVWLGSCSLGKPNPSQDPAAPNPIPSSLNLNDLDNIPLGDRHLASDGTFSFQPPANWQAQTVAGLTYQTFVQNSDAAVPTPANSEVNGANVNNATNPTTEGDRYQANISIFSDTYAGSLTDYAAVNLNSVSKAFQNFQTLSQTEFTTNSGLPGMVIVSTSEQLGNQLWQSFYIFDAPANRKLVITCSALASDADRLASIFAASLKTLQIE
jgi:hypothetical protein